MCPAIKESTKKILSIYSHNKLSLINDQAVIWSAERRSGRDGWIYDSAEQLYYWKLFCNSIYLGPPYSLKQKKKKKLFLPYLHNFF